MLYNDSKCLFVKMIFFGGRGCSLAKKGANCYLARQTYSLFRAISQNKRINLGKGLCVHQDSETDCKNASPHLIQPFVALEGICAASLYGLHTRFLHQAQHCFEAKLSFWCLNCPAVLPFPLKMKLGLHLKWAHWNPLLICCVGLCSTTAIHWPGLHVMSRRGWEWVYSREGHRCFASLLVLLLLWNPELSHGFS